MNSPGRIYEFKKRQNLSTVNFPPRTTAVVVSIAQRWGIEWGIF